jgi:hypothetical protein
VIHQQLRKYLLAFGAIIALGSALVLVLASQRIAAEQSAYHVPAAGRCTPSTLNASAVLPGTSLSVSPLPGTYAASPRTQISLLGVPGGELRAVRVNGSLSGRHPGQLRAYSQGDGASFLPFRPFAAGEIVTVRGNIRRANHVTPFAFRFTVAHEDPVVYVPWHPPRLHPKQLQHFRSRPDLAPPAITVSTHAAPGSPAATPGSYVFASPYNGPGPAGPLIFDEAGNVVWFSPLPSGIDAANLQVQDLDGAPVLTYWRGRIPPQGFGEGEEVILNNSYREVGRVHAGNGYKADLHDFHIGPRDTALLTAFNPIDCDLSAVGGPHGGAVTDGVFEEVDLRTGLVRREWHSVDHVPLSDSYSTSVGTSTSWPFDYFHINSIVEQPNGTTLISARNTSALYELRTATGRVIQTIGGRSSSIRLAAAANTAYQHDARVLADGTISIFDNGGVPQVHQQSRGIILRLNRGARTGEVVSQFVHTTPLLSASQGNFQLLAGGGAFIGWGSEPYFSEYSASGQTLFDAHLPNPYQSYRGYRFAWAGVPVHVPAIAVVHASSAGPETVFASWNGDTRTVRWRVLAGNSPDSLAPIADAAHEGFETAVPLPGPVAYVAVEALDAGGHVLARSGTARG